MNTFSALDTSAITRNAERDQRTARAPAAAPPSKWTPSAPSLTPLAPMSGARSSVASVGSSPWMHDAKKRVAGAGAGVSPSRSGRTNIRPRLDLASAF